MRHVCLLLLATLSLFGARRAIADDQTGASPLSRPTIVFAATAASDWATTYHGISHGYFAEGNSLINRWQDHPAAMVAAGSAMDVASVMVWNRFVGRRHPKIAAVGLYAASAFLAYLTVKGIALINRANTPSENFPR